MMRCFSAVFIPRLLPYTYASPTVYTLSIFFKNSEQLVIMRCFSTVFIPRLLHYTYASPTVYIYEKHASPTSVDLLQEFRATGDDALFHGGIYFASASLYLCVSNFLYSVDLLQEFRATDDDALFLYGIYSASATLY